MQTTASLGARAITVHKLAFLLCNRYFCTHIVKGELFFIIYILKFWIRGFYLRIQTVLCITTHFTARYLTGENFQQLQCVHLLLARTVKSCHRYTSHWMLVCSHVLMENWEKFCQPAFYTIKYPDGRSNRRPPLKCRIPLRYSRNTFSAYVINSFWPIFLKLRTCY
jgi:hypothetical protein